MIIILIVGGILIVYLAGTLFIAGKSFAYWQRHYPKWLADEDKRGDFIFSIFTGLFWWGTWIWVLLGSNPISTQKYRSFGWTLNYKNPQGKGDKNA